MNMCLITKIYLLEIFLTVNTYLSSNFQKYFDGTQDRSSNPNRKWRFYETRGASHKTAIFFYFDVLSYIEVFLKMRQAIRVNCQTNLLKVFLIISNARNRLE